MNRPHRASATMASPPFIALLCLLLFSTGASGYQYWNDIRSSALLPDDTVIMRMENPTGGGEENYVIYRDSGIAEALMSAVPDGPSTLSATVPGPVAEDRNYGFRLLQGSELDFMPLPLASGVSPQPGDLTRVAEDAAGDELFGYQNLDLVDCHVSFSDSEIHASLTNVGGGFPVASGLTFFGYLLGIADPAAADPDTVFALMETYDQSGVISPGLYKITGTGMDNLEKIGEVTVQEFPADNSLVLSCQLSDLLSDPYFLSWYDPSDPAIGVAGFTQRITLLGGAQEADQSPGGRCYLREHVVQTGPNQLPTLTNPVFDGSGSLATAAIDYLDSDGHCPVTADIVFDESDTFALYPQSLDYSTTVTYVTDAGIQPLADGTWSVAVFRVSDNGTDVVEYLAPATGVEEALQSEPGSLLSAATPSPFSRSTSITLHMPAPGRAEAAVYDVRGARVRTLAGGELPAGPNVLRWNGKSDAGRQVPSGVYFVRAAAPGATALRKLILVR
ncbi:MAG: hypothetical protein GF400_09520 [Candidatus Eisenbacteria bacterium]|nr:hypothetical protein [Candidatus Eisenbacteria bacterium]